MRTGAIVLCGGKSSRMGMAKSSLPFGSELMLQRIVRTIALELSPIVVVIARDQSIPPLPTDVEIVTDDVPECGPMGGLASGLRALQDRVDCVYLSGCDTPLLRREFIRRVVGLSEGYSIAIPRIQDFFHNLAAVYDVAILPIVDEQLHVNQLRMTSLIEKVSARVIDANELRNIDPELESLRNANTFDEYQALLDAARIGGRI